MLVPLVGAGREQGGLVVRLGGLCRRYWVVFVCCLSIVACLVAAWYPVPVCVSFIVGLVGVLLPVGVFWVLLRFVALGVRVVLGLLQILRRVCYSWFAVWGCRHRWCHFQYPVVVVGSRQRPQGGRLLVVHCPRLLRDQWTTWI